MWSSRRPQAGRCSPQPTHPQYANYWAQLTRKRHILPHSAQPQHANHWAPRTRKRHQQEHRPQRPTESSDPTQHSKGRTGDCPGPHKGATTRRNVTQGGASETEDRQRCPRAVRRVYMQSARRRGRQQFVSSDDPRPQGSSRDGCSQPHSAGLLPLTLTLDHCLAPT